MFKCRSNVPSWHTRICPTSMFILFRIKYDFLYRGVGGARGVLLKSKILLVYAHCEILGLILGVGSRFNVNSHWCISLPHSLIGSIWWKNANSANIWFLNVHIARFVALHWCWWGGTNSNFVSVPKIANLRLYEQSLSETNSSNVWLCFVNWSYALSNTAAMTLPHIIFIGSATIGLLP